MMRAIPGLCRGQGLLASAPAAGRFDWRANNANSHGEVRPGGGADHRGC